MQKQERQERPPKEMELVYTYKTNNNEEEKKEEKTIELNGQPSIDLVPQIALRDHTCPLCFSNYHQSQEAKASGRERRIFSRERGGAWWKHCVTG